jgi:hypothetical protein
VGRDRLCRKEHFEGEHLQCATVIKVDRTCDIYTVCLAGKASPTVNKVGRTCVHYIYIYMLPLAGKASITWPMCIFTVSRVGRTWVYYI